MTSITRVRVAQEKVREQISEIYEPISRESLKNMVKDINTRIRCNRVEETTE